MASHLLGRLLLQVDDLVLPVNPLRLQLTRQQVRVLQRSRTRQNISVFIEQTKHRSRRILPLVEVRRSSRRGRCLPHTRTAPSSRPSYWPPADERSYLRPQTSTRTGRLVKHKKHWHRVWWSDTDQCKCEVSIHSDHFNHIQWLWLMWVGVLSLSLYMCCFYVL